MARTFKPAAARATLNGNGHAQPGQLSAEEARPAAGSGPQREDASSHRQMAQPYVSLKQRVILKLRRLAAEVGRDHTQSATMQPHRYSFAAEEIAKQRRQS